MIQASVSWNFKETVRGTAEWLASVNLNMLSLRNRMERFIHSISMDLQYESIKNKLLLVQESIGVYFHVQKNSLLFKDDQLLI